jgi:hypothetical protein
MAALRFFMSCHYLIGEAFNQDSHQQIEEDIVAKGHQGHKVKGCPVASSLHAQEQHNIPIFLGQNLQYSRGLVC